MLVETQRHRVDLWNSTDLAHAWLARFDTSLTKQIVARITPGPALLSYMRHHEFIIYSVNLMHTETFRSS